MCKLFVMTNMSKVKTPQKAITTICDVLSDYEKDGIGYAAQGAKGLFGERSIKPDTFRFSFNSKILDAPYVKHGFYNRFGTYAKPTGAGIFHGRTSTNDCTLLNTHPINKNGWSLSHNGVVTNHGPKYEMVTTNDTEHLVQLLSTEGISAIERDITGYYAAAAFDPEGRLHVFRDSIADLFVAEVPELETTIFCTKESIIRDVCRLMDWKTSIIHPMKDNQYLVFENGSLISCQDIKPRGRTATESRFASLSLGRDLDEPRKLDFGFDWSQYTDEHSSDEQAFLDEVKMHADDTYTFFDYNNKQISYDEFMDLDEGEMLYCTVVRPDGTVVDPKDYKSEKLYEGVVLAK